MCALIGRVSNAVSEKKRVVDNAIAYADMLLKRLKEIPADAQQTARHLAGNFFRILEEAKEMSDKVVEHLIQ